MDFIVISRHRDLAQAERPAGVGGTDRGRDEKKNGPVLESKIVSAGRRNGGFDRWLDRSLHELYDKVLGEDLPEDLRKLIEKFDSKEKSERHGQQPPQDRADRSKVD